MSKVVVDPLFFHSLFPSKTGDLVGNAYTRGRRLDPETGSAGAGKGCSGVFSLV
jgi:hypothetical protein